MKVLPAVTRWLLVWALAGIAWPAQGAQPPQPLRVTDVGEQPLAGFLSGLHDPTGGLTLADVLGQDEDGRFSPLPTYAGSLGFRHGATWLRFSLVNGLDSATHRWLELNFPFLQHCTLYSVGADRRILRTESGAAVGLDQRPVHARAILFPVHLEPKEQRWFYLRIQTRTAVVADLTLWDPGRFADATMGAMALKYLGTGSSCVVIMLSIVAARARREWRLLGAGLGHLLIALVLVTQDGLLFSLITPIETPWQSQLAWSLAFSGFACQFLFARAFLGLASRQRSLDWLSRGSTAVTTIAALMPWIAFAPKYFAMVAITVILCMTLVTMRMAWRGESTANWYAAVWGAFWVAALIYLLQLVGWPGNVPFLRNNVVVIGFCASGFMLCAALYVYIERFRSEADAARGQLLAHMASEKQRLATAIAEQTQALREAKRRAEQASCSKSAFLSASSHELRTPLHTIIGYAELMLREASGETRARLHTVANSSRQLLRVIDDVLQFSRAQALVPEIRNDNVELGSLLGHVERSGNLLSRRGSNRFVLSMSPGLPAIVRTDEQRLLQVLGNLIENAAKYTDHGTIRLDVAVDDAPSAVDGSDEGVPIRFAVSDDGPGIPLDEQSDIFQPFRRGSTGRTRQGTGLGLAIAQDLVAALGGRIGVQSMPGAGSTFSFTLALHPVTPTLHESEVERWITGHHPPQRTLLLVDDHAENLHLLDTLCQSMGFRTFTAAAVDAALRVCDEHARELDGVLVDQRMPGADGWALLRELRQREAMRVIPIILMSATPAEPPEDLPLDMHFDATILKPIAFDALSQTLARLLGVRWQYAENAAQPAAMAGAMPPASRLAECRPLLERGSITGLIRWAQQLGKQEPRYRDFCDAVAAACRAADLREVERLVGNAIDAGAKTSRAAI